ncbi:MAG TPA: hypothetical protein VH969_20560 [Actinophytocola sp.]|jgi:hypothetical protein|uniref:PepSY domain-containing protein n=1 Tax=Actinophytocola sp. TaxID=1872138 RepID=UPI002F95250E
MKRIVIVAALAAGLVTAGAGIALATGQQDDNGSDRPITGPALDKATAAALDHTGGGKVTGTEAGDEEGAYEVEVTMSDGRQIDVHLDGRFTVLGSASDRDDSGR